jgi:hypothetical protein
VSTDDMALVHAWTFRMVAKDFYPEERRGRARYRIEADPTARAVPRR